MLKKVITSIALLLVLGAVVVGVASYVVSRPVGGDRLDPGRLERHEIADAELALSFARTVGDDGVRLLVVNAWEAGEVTAADITDAFAVMYRDPVDALASVGFEAVAAAAQSSAKRSYAPEDLVMPLELNYPHIAAGTNFKAHAEEVGTDGEPFLFPKLARPTPWFANVSVAARLDYEAEVCVVPLRYLSRTELATDELPGSLGYLLCNDYTDRYRLMSDIDLSEPMGLTGFAGGKGGESFLPVGPLLVVPREGWDFYREIRLFLWVNDELRQRDTAGLMVWSPREILARALAACETPYLHEGEEIRLSGCDGVAGRTLVLTGTPAGVAFHPINLWYPGFYLQSGDEVVTVGRYLGMLRNLVLDP
ncbi:MAG: fumarylacetoacetate hydrolase family protein [Gammaproteobacteria bacterium]|nr:fumarylacetoacetate hydrolase family protein [Gammaproteobacteria bacterium]